MEMHQIRYFLAVARERNFSRAAEQCNITQPALTRAIQKLEEEVGGQLFDRRPGRIELTELGRTLLPRLQNAFQEVARARTDASDLHRHRKHRLRLGVMCTICPDRLIGLVQGLKKTFPHLEFELREAKGSAIVAALLADEIDVGLVGLPIFPDAVDAIPLYTERYVLALPARHRFATANSVALAELDGEDYIERLNCEFDDYFEACHGEWPIKLNSRYRSEREDWVQAMISAGMGLAIVPESLPLQSGITTSTLVSPEIERTICAVTVRDRVLPAAAREWLRTLETFDWS
jgi:LysR family transcriptional regulator, hydrogen peroxide-inducible genes activator